MIQGHETASSAPPGARSLLWLNAIGGVAVLGSYAHGFATHPLARADLWGGVPESLRPLYTASMLTATAGYFAFSYFVFFRLDPATARVLGRFRFSAFHLLYAMVLIPSALWLPLTFTMLEAPSPALWTAIRVTLLLVGLGSVGLVAAVASAAPAQAPVSRAIAVAGALAFSFQTAVLDALVWPYYFPV